MRWKNLLAKLYFLRGICDIGNFEPTQERVHSTLYLKNLCVIRKQNRNLSKIPNLRKYIREIAKCDYAKFINLPDRKLRKICAIPHGNTRAECKTQQNLKDAKIQQCINWYGEFNTHPELADATNETKPVLYSETWKTCHIYIAPTHHVTHGVETKKELNKHILYHRHLTQNAKEYYEIPNGNNCINRWNPREIGLQSRELFLRNNNVVCGQLQNNGDA